MIPNFVDTDGIAPARPARRAYRRELGIGDETVVMYAGNVGFSQSLELLLDGGRGADATARRRVRRERRRLGPRRPASAGRPGLANVRFADYQPKERLAEVLATGDIHVVPLKRGLARSSVPSKTYSILAAGRPLVASVDPGTEVARVVERAGLRRRRARPTTRPPSSTPSPGSLDDPARRGGDGRRGPGVRRALGVAGGRGRRLRGAVRGAGAGDAIAAGTEPGSARRLVGKASSSQEGRSGRPGRQGDARSARPAGPGVPRRHRASSSSSASC